MIITEPETSIPLPPPSSSPEATSLNDLPNEVLHSILQPFSTVSLLPFLRISQRFARLILNLIHNRLVVASYLTGTRSVQLECYRPLDRLRAETLSCNPLGTQGLEPPNPKTTVVDQLRQYNSCFTRFRPYRKGTNRIRPRRHPAGDIPGTRTYHASAEQGSAAPSSSSDNATTPSSVSTNDLTPDELLPPVKQLLTLDPSEVFTQLQTITSLVTSGPKSGLIYSAITASEGVLRVFRSWLSAQDARRKRNELPPPETPVPLSDPSILWVNDRKQNVGVRFTVAERKLRRDAPVLLHVDEDVAVSYDVLIEECVVRTRHLLMVAEEGMRERMAAVGGKAVVIGNW